MRGGWDVSGLYPVVDFDISSVEHLDSTTRELRSRDMYNQ
jgi:hypothetical protein